MALSNDLKVLTWIANKGLAYLLTNLPYIHCGETQYMPEFDNREYAKGDTIQIRRSNRRIGGEGATINLDGVVEKTESLVIEKQFNDGLAFSSKEQALFTTGEYGREIYAERYIMPSINRLVHQINSYIGQKFEYNTNLYYGAPSTPINSPSVIANVRALMEDMNMPVAQNENYLILNPSDGAVLKNSMVNYFNPTFHKGIGEKFFLKEIMDFQFESTSAVPYHTTGTIIDDNATLQVNADVTSGNTIVIKGTHAGKTVKKGDIFTVDGAYLVAPSTYKTTTHKAVCVVTSDVTAAGATVSVNFALQGDDGAIIDTTNPFLNLSAKFATDAVVTFIASHNVGCAFVKGALDYAMPRMQKMWTPFCVDVTDDKFGTGISLRLSRAADIVNDKNIMRWDVLVGAKVHGEYAVRIIS